MRIIPTLAGLALVACGDGSETPMFEFDCTGAQAFALPMTVQTAGDLEVTLQHAQPAPIDVGDNTWTLAITTSDGDPAIGLEPRIRPWMPLHGHGVSPVDYGGTEVSEGTYEMETFDLIMPGLWELHVELPDGDAAVFALCAEG